MRIWLKNYWAKLAAGLALATVAAVTGRISYTHIYDLTLSLHQPVMVARLMAFGVDGLIVVGSVILLDSTPVDWWLGWVGIGPGASISLFANVESGIRWGWLAASWAGVPAASFTLATFMLERWLKTQAKAALSNKAKPAGSPAPAKPIAPAVRPAPGPKAVQPAGEPVPAPPNEPVPAPPNEPVPAPIAIPARARTEDKAKRGKRDPAAASRLLDEPPAEVLEAIRMGASAADLTGQFSEIGPYRAKQLIRQHAGNVMAEPAEWAEFDGLNLEDAR